MASRRTRLPREGVPLPESGERVMMPPQRSPLNKPPKSNTPEEDAAVKVAAQRRKGWEATPEGQQRTAGYKPVSGMGVGMRYFIDQTDVPRDRGPRVYDRQLPGMSDPNAAPRPPKWEELTETQRSHTTKSLKRFGTNIDRMTSDLGAQLDQAHDRARRNDTDSPYASDFYETGAPRQRIEETAKRLDVPVPIHAMMNAFTSPNTKFSLRKATGEVSYPNDEAAEHATRWVRQGGDPEKITNEMSTTGMGTKRVQGYVTNIRKAARAMHAHDRGIAPADWRVGARGEEGGGAFDKAPKTGPYANSWSDSHPQYTVADVHTGGGGAFPHLGTEKELYDEAGGSGGNRKKSEREEALARVPFVHSAIDYSMRQAMAQRNLGSVRRAQAAQWGEEQLQRGEQGLRGAPREHEAYPGRETVSTDSAGQLSLGFTQHARRQNHLAEMNERVRKYQREHADEVF